MPGGGSGRRRSGDAAVPSPAAQGTGALACAVAPSEARSVAGSAFGSLAVDVSRSAAKGFGGAGAFGGRAPNPEEWIEAWERRAAADMVQDLETCGADQDLEELRAAWATPSVAAAPSASRLNRRGDLAARRLWVVEDLRKVADGRAPARVVTEASTPGAPFAALVAPRTDASPASRDAARHTGRPRKASRPRPTCSGNGAAEKEDVELDLEDPWAAWESRWAETFERLARGGLLPSRASGRAPSGGRTPSREPRPEARSASASRGGTPGGSARGRTPSREPRPEAPRSASASRGGAPGAGAKAPPRRPPPRTDAMPPRPPQGAARAPARRFADFAAYEVAWAAFMAAAAGGAESPLRCADVPWPLELPTVSGIEPCDDPGQRKRKLRAALLRWHPDKWAPILERIAEAEQPNVLAKVEEVTRRIIDERTRLGAS